MRASVKTLTLLAWFVVVPTAAFAQAVIAGTVKDPSGAVLPGVVVEAASPALIEKVRAAVTDGTGQYRIEDLRPGAYTVTFTLQGFSTFRREGIELSGSFTATDQRGAQGRRARRNDHRHGRNASRGRAERETGGDAERRRHQVHPVGPQLQRHGRRRARRGHQSERHGDGDGHDPVSHPRRTQQRRPHDDRRAQHRESDRRQSAARVRRGHRQLPGSHLHDVWRSR